MIVLFFTNNNAFFSLDKATEKTSGIIIYNNTFTNNFAIKYGLSIVIYNQIIDWYSA